MDSNIYRTLWGLFDAASARLQDLSSSNQKFQHFNWEPIDSFTYFETEAKSSK